MGAGRGPVSLLIDFTIKTKDLDFGIEIDRASSRDLTEDRTPSLKHLTMLSDG